MAAISAITSQRKVVGTNGGRGSIPLLDNSEKAIASVATTIAAARTLFFIRAKRYAGWMRVSMVADREKPSEMKTGGGEDQTFHPGGKTFCGGVLPQGYKARSLGFKIPALHRKGPHKIDAPP